MAKLNWHSTGPGGCDSHCIEHPCGPCFTGRYAPQILSLDIETTGLDPWPNEILLTGLYDGVEYIPCRSKEVFQMAMAWFPHHELVCHNSGFDIKWLLVKGWLRDADVAKMRIHDTRALAHVYTEKVPDGWLKAYELRRKALNKMLPKGKSHREAGPLSLKALAPYFLGVEAFWEKPGQYDDEEYNRKDCVYTWQLLKLLRSKVEAESNLAFYERLLGYQSMITQMEIKGIAVSNDALHMAEGEYSALRAEYKAKLDEQWTVANQEWRNRQWRKIKSDYRVKHIAKPLSVRQRAAEERKLARVAPLNYSSPKQLTWLFKEQFGLNITSPEGDETTGKAVLQRLANEGHKDIENFLNWRKADKILTMYIPTYKELQYNGTIHPNFNLAGTRTGRLSSSSPNLQQVPPELYSIFIPRSGHKFIQYDLAGIEAALIALYSDDEKLIEILEKGESIHDHNAKALFGLSCGVRSVSAEHPRERKAAKTIGFACFYGAGWQRIKTAFQSAGFSISDKEAKAKLRQLREYYGRAFAFHKEITKQFESGETIHNVLGRPIKIQSWENAYMQGLNTLVQSSASDLCVEAASRYASAGGNVLLLIHDYILAEEPKGQAKARSALLRECMTGFNLVTPEGKRIQLKVEGDVADRWEKIN